MEFGNYAESQKQEENTLNGAEYYIKAEANKKPVFDYIEVISLEKTSATIKVKAIDLDKEKLTYKLYLGLDKDNLEEQENIEKDVEESTEVEFQITGIDITKIWYYRIDVQDEYATVKSEINILTNKPPKITAEITKDIAVNESDPTKSTSWIQIEAKAEDTDNDKLDVKIYLGKSEAENLGQADLIGSKTEVDTRIHFDTKEG